jgi:hypothetical protein
MAISLYQATVPQHLQIVTAARALLDKAEEWTKQQGRSEADFLATTLAPDMWPLAKQFQLIAVHSAGAVKGAIAGVFAPDISEAPRNFAELRARLDEALAELRAIDAAALDAAEDKDLSLEIRGKVLMRFKGADFLLSFAQPNFYFHVTAAYAILRNLGIDVGKRDFMGVPRLLQPG